MAEILNLQPRGSQAKAYQVKQVRGVIVSYGMAAEPEANPLTGETPPGEDIVQSNSESDAHEK